MLDMCQNELAVRASPKTRLGAYSAPQFPDSLGGFRGEEQTKEGKKRKDKRKGMQGKGRGRNGKKGLCSLAVNVSCLSRGGELVALPTPQTA